MAGRFTTTVGGASVIAAALLTFLLSLTPFTLELDYHLYSIIAIASSVVLAVGLCVLAFGAVGENGIVGRSRVGRAALVVFGVLPVIQHVVGVWSAELAMQTSIASATALGYVTLTMAAVATAASLVAAVTVVRARVLTGVARYAMVPPVALNALLFLLGFVPTAALVDVSNAGFTVALVLQFAWGLVLVLVGRSDDLRRRIETIDKAW